MTASIATRAFRRLTGNGWVFDPFGAGVRIVAVGGALAVGWAMRQPLAGVLGAGGAFTVGFGAPLDLRGSHPLLLLVATLAIGACAVVGALVGASGFTAVAYGAVLGGLCGIAASRSPGVAWTALQCGLAGVVATSYPASLEAAAERASVIAAGGLAQAAALTIATLALHRFPPPPTAERETMLYPVQVAAGLAVAVWLERRLALRNGYWVPLTTLIVLRPGVESTFARAVSRTFGTVGGAAVASLILLGLRPPLAWIGALVAAAAFAAYLFQKATYALLSASVAAYAVFLLSFAGVPEGQAAFGRIVATALGALVGLAVHGADALSKIASRSASWRRSSGRR
jgi:hypothetical protein